jgi:BirA family biotin operon repressor/biotin-[acetyl-CoA-carboxylase] ligase
MTPDPVPADVAAALSRAGLPPVVFFTEVDSTNDHALSLADLDAPEFTAVLADVQRAGRGRRGRTWFSPPGAGMYLSVIVRGDGLDSQLPLLTMAAGVAVAEAVTSVSGLPVELKWPNDLVIGRPWRKLAGILCEASALGSSKAAVVVGVGVNLDRAAYPREVADRATSLAAECDLPVGRAALVAACLVQLRARVADLRANETTAVLERWRALGRAGLDHAPVRWTDERGACRGIAYGVDAGGALLVRHAGPVGQPAEGDARERLIAGDVEWELLSRV